MANPTVISCLLILNFVRSLVFCNMPALLVGFQRFCVKSMFFLFTQINFVSQTESPKGGGVTGDAATPRKYCRSCKRHLGSRAGERRDDTAMGARSREGPSAAEMEMVMERLGLKLEEEAAAQWDGRCRDCYLMEAAQDMLEEKEASVEEVAEAFAVFDRDGDGYVGAEELREVMWRLGMAEGAELEDCRRMIGAYDENGDGRIDLAEFSRLLEIAA